MGGESGPYLWSLAANLLNTLEQPTKDVLPV